MSTAHQIISKVVVLILGAVVLVGCQKQGDSGWERPRMAGEVMDSVALASGELAGVACINQLMKNEEAGGEEVTSEMIKKECGMKTSAVSNQSAATMSRSRLFMGNNNLRGYYYLPYYIDINYTTTTSTYPTTSNTSYSSSDLYNLIFGVPCKKTNWYDTYFGYNYNTNYQSYNQQYNPGCYSWLAYNANTYASNGFTNFWTNPTYYAPSSWNNSWYGCFNYYY